MWVWQVKVDFLHDTLATLLIHYLFACATDMHKPVNEELDLWDGLVAGEVLDDALRSTQLGGHLGILV